MSGIDDVFLGPDPSDGGRLKVTFNGVEIGHETFTYTVLSPDEWKTYVPPRASRRERAKAWLSDHMPHVHLGPCRPDEDWWE